MLHQDDQHTFCKQCGQEQQTWREGSAKNLCETVVIQHTIPLQSANALLSGERPCLGTCMFCARETLVTLHHRSHVAMFYTTMEHGFDRTSVSYQDLTRPIPMQDLEGQTRWYVSWRKVEMQSFHRYRINHFIYRPTYTRTSHFVIIAPFDEENCVLLDSWPSRRRRSGIDTYPTKNVEVDKIAALFLEEDAQYVEPSSQLNTTDSSHPVSPDTITEFRVAELIVMAKVRTIVFPLLSGNVALGTLPSHSLRKSRYRNSIISPQRLEKDSPTVSRPWIGAKISNSSCST